MGRTKQKIKTVRILRNSQEQGRIRTQQWAQQEGQRSSTHWTTHLFRGCAGQKRHAMLCYAKIYFVFSIEKLMCGSVALTFLFLPKNKNRQCLGWT